VETTCKKKGNADAQYNLSVIYYRGERIIQDNVYAHMWRNIAASSGNKNAVKYRNIVAKQMTPAQITEAQKLPKNVSVRNTKGVKLGNL
jgi:uncharacterized protein